MADRIFGDLRRDRIGQGPFAFAEIAMRVDVQCRYRQAARRLEDDMLNSLR